MKHKNILLLFFFVNIVNLVFGQSIGSCQKVFKNAQVMPLYKSGIKDLMIYVNEELFPIFNSYPDKDDMTIFGKHIVELTIDYQGQVVEVNFPKSTLLRSFLDELREKIKTMEGWSPGQMNGERVCTKVTFPFYIELDNH